MFLRKKIVHIRSSSRLAHDCFLRSQETATVIKTSISLQALVLKHLSENFLIVLQKVFELASAGTISCLRRYASRSGRELEP
jgi:hypothetical protein